LANTAQAKKRARQAEKHRQLNTSQRSALRTSVKNVVKAVVAGEKAKAEETYKVAVPMVDKMARKGFIHKNKAARQKSRLNAAIRAMPA